MRGVTHAGNTHARTLRFVDGHLHRAHASKLAHGKMCIQQRRNRSLAHHLDLRMRIHAARGDILMIVHHPLRSVALNGKLIREHQHIGDGVCILCRESFAHKYALHKRTQRFF